MWKSVVFKLPGVSVLIKQFGILSAPASGQVSLFSTRKQTANCISINYNQNPYPVRPGQQPIPGNPILRDELKGLSRAGQSQGVFCWAACAGSALQHWWISILNITSRQIFKNSKFYKNLPDFYKKPVWLVYLKVQHKERFVILSLKTLLAINSLNCEHF